ncbi:type IV secretory system conjugative DNA transfer family protein [Methylobacterium sp. C25]|uniref:type IV secretory system conjugative DNA transfer family protein n=1 Tax=Methylobacterium sp. C25 TaxID=2721622 RepID=UPI001F285BF6|nr:type IV secretory system conjugative DNA transfer family protein [Methylobacterium sp. C25]MCE4225953.1 type IV secretory system conjugative DNA transfer family protein [Methylobacterium sp. C25]
MVTPSLPIRVFLALIVDIAILILAYPVVFVLVHGLNPAGWPTGELDPLAWFEHLTHLTEPKHALAAIAVLYETSVGQATALHYGGAPVFYGLMGLLALVPFLIISRGQRMAARHGSTRYGNAHWAYPKDVKRMRRGLELGRDPKTGRAVRVIVEGNLLTIAPPRSGKTSGLILPNLVMPEVGAWGGPVVVIDPKGDAYRAARRRREAMGRQVHCLDPLGLIGGTDRWNPLLHTNPSDTTALLATAAAMLPEAKDDLEAGQYFRSRASVLLAAAMRQALSGNDTDAAIVAASNLVGDPDRFAAALIATKDKLSEDALSILGFDSRSRDPLLSTAAQALQFLLDERLRAVMSDHTFDLTDLAGGNLDLFIVTPADERRKILAPYLRWLLAELFATIRKNRPSERIVVFIDEAAVLGRFDAISKGVGELPGYGVSIWSFWQNRAQIIDTYGQAGADNLFGTAEVTTLFNTSRVLPDEAEYWSRAIGTFTGVDTEEVAGPGGGTIIKRRPVEERLVPATELNGITQRQAIHFLSGSAHTSDPLLLDKTRPFVEERFAGLLDTVAPVGPLKI